MFHLRALAKGFPLHMTLHFLFFATKGIVIPGEWNRVTASANSAWAAARRGCRSATSTLQPSPGLSICRSCQQPRVREAPQSPGKVLSISQQGAGHLLQGVDHLLARHWASLEWCGSSHCRGPPGTWWSSWAAGHRFALSQGEYCKADRFGA